MDNHTDISLDEPELYQRLDPSGLRERIADLPYQCLHAWEEGLRFSLPSSYRKARQRHSGRRGRLRHRRRADG